MQCPINKQTNFFSVEIQKKEHDFSSKIDSVITTKIKPNSISAENLKSQIDYTGEDAEVWVFTANGAEIE